MFDPVVYLTDDEYFNIHGKHVNVQSIVEKPYLYILARCHSDDSQLLYSSERLDDLLNLNEDVEYNNKQIRDIVRVFKGDKPACQFEAAQQKMEIAFIGSVLEMLKWHQILFMLCPIQTHH